MSALKPPRPEASPPLDICKQRADYLTNARWAGEVEL